MAATEPAYDLTIIDGDGNALFGTFSGGTITESDFRTPHTSLGSHPREYLKIPENFTSAEIDFLEGSSSIGAVTVPVLDKRQTSTDQTSGLLTSKIDEVIGLRAILRRYDPDSATWKVQIDGVIHAYTEDRESVVVYNLHLRDGREFEREGELFESNFVLWGKDGKTGPLIDYGRNHQLEAVFGSLAQPLIEAVEPFESIDTEGINHFNNIGSVDFDGTTVYGGFASVATLIETPSGFQNVITNELSIPDLGEPSFEASDGIPRYKDIRILWRAKGSNDAFTELRDFPALNQAPHNVIYDPFVVTGFVDLSTSRAPVIWFGSFTQSDIPTDGQEIEFKVVSNVITDDTPFFWDGGTVGDLLQEIADGDHTDEPPSEQYDATELTNFAANSPYARMILREKVTDRRKWVQEHIYKPALRAPAFDAEYEIFPASWVFPSDTSGIAALDPDTVEVIGDWNHGISNAVREVRFTYIKEALQPEDVYRRENSIDDDLDVFPWDRLVETEIEVTQTASDAVTGAKTLTYEPVTIRALGNMFDQTEDGKDLSRLVAERAIETVLPRFKKGAPTYIVRVHATSDNLDLRPGDWVKLPLRALPNYSDGTRPDTTGPRGYFQIYGISDPTVEHRELRLVSARVLDPTNDPDLTDPGGTDCLVTGDGTLVAAPSGASLRYFTADGDIVNNCGSDITVKLLAIGGGGGGGEGASDEASGGGGAGGVLGDDGTLEVTIGAGETVPVRIGAGGSTNSDGEDTVLWVDSNGNALDPLSDPKPSATTAVGGGSGGGGNDGGGSGGSGGGGGTQLAVGSGQAGGSGTSGQGEDGGDGQGQGGGSVCARGAGGGGGSLAGAGQDGSIAEPAVGGAGGAASALTTWGVTAGGGGEGGAAQFQPMGATNCDSAGGEFSTPGAQGDGDFGAGGGGGARGSGATGGTAGFLAVIYAGAAQTLTAPDVTSTTVSSDRSVKICVEGSDWPTIEPAGYQVRVEYAVTASGDSEPAEDANDWILAGVLTDPGCVWTDPVPPGSKVWHRVRAEADNFPPSDWGTTGSDTLAQTPDLLAWDLVIDQDTGIGTATWTANSFTGGIRLRGKRHDTDGDTSRDLPEIADLDASLGTYEITSITVAKGQYETVDFETWQEIPESIERTTSGLVFRDQFNASNQNINGYNSWVESDAGSFAIVSNEVQARWGTNGARRMVQNLGDQGSFIMQVAALRNSESVTAVLLANMTSESAYGTAYILIEKDGSGYDIRKVGTGSLGSGGTAQSTAHTLRFVLDTTTSPKELRAYSANGIDDLQDLDDDLTLRASGTDAAARSTDTYYGIEVGDGSNQGDSDLDEYFICGRDIVISGLPTGYQAQVDGRSAVTESSGTVTFDVDTWALPATEIKVLDGSSVEVATLTPSGGIFGGDSYTFHPDASPNTEGVTRRASDLRDASDQNDDNELDNRLVLDNNLERVLDNNLNPVTDSPP